MKKDTFDNYLADYISETQLKNLLKFVMSKPRGEPFFVLEVKDSGDGMVEGEAKTWLQISNSREDKLCYMLQDDDGKTELNQYDLSIGGLADCLDNISSLQDELNNDEFWDLVKSKI